MPFSSSWIIVVETYMQLHADSITTWNLNLHAVTRGFNYYLKRFQSSVYDSKSFFHIWFFRSCDEKNESQPEKMKHEKYAFERFSRYGNGKMDILLQKVKRVFVACYAT